MADHMGLLHQVVADDGNGRKFGAFTRHPHPEPEEHVLCAVWIDGENGWQANIGDFAGLKLKKTDDGTFQS